jgi:hypothetical protein
VKTKRKARPAAQPEPARAPIEPYLVPVRSLLTKGSTMPAAEPLSTPEALKRILALLNRVPDDADRKKILAALAALA